VTAFIEFTPSFVPRPDLTHVLFDFDGTLSLVRAGWADVMVGLFLDHLPPGTDPAEIHHEIQ
jgi:phosphoglycolate phosphatase